MPGYSQDWRAPLTRVQAREQEFVRNSSGTSRRGSAVLEAPEAEYASEVSSRSSRRKVAAPERPASRDYAGFEDDFDEEFDGGGRAPRRQQKGLRLRLRGGLPKSLGGKLGVLAGLLLVAGLCVAAAMVARTAILRDERFVIPSSRAIEVSGNAHVSRAQLLTVFGEDVERNIFRVPLEARRAELEQLPWVEHATVMRLLPNRLRVAIVERTPVAFARQGNRIGLVDGNGVLLNIPTDVQAEMKYSFPVVTGMAVSDPLSLRAARMKVFARFMGDLDSQGEKVSANISEVDLSNPEDVRAVVADKGGDVMVHFGEDNFLDRYRKFEDHLTEWRTQYPRLSSVDMRYERQVVLEMQKGSGADANQTIANAASNGAVDVKAASAPAHVTKAPVKAKAAGLQAARAPAKAKVAAKPVAKSTAAKTSVAKAAQKKGVTAAGHGTGAEKTHPPQQVVHR